MPLQDVLSPMAGLLKPGGWIQLMEGDFAPVEANGPAMREFLELGGWFFEVAGPGRGDFSFDFPIYRGS